MKIRISKSPQQRGAVQMPAPMPMPAMLPPAAAARMTRRGGDAGHRRRAARRPRRRSRTSSRSSRRWSGTFYAQPEPGAKPYVTVGDSHHEGADPLHHRGDEDHERDRVRVRRGGAGSSRSGRASSRVRTGALQHRSQWLIPHWRTDSTAAAAARRAASIQLQGHAAADGPAERVRPAPQGGSSADAARARRALGRCRCRRCVRRT